VFSDSPGSTTRDLLQAARSAAVPLRIAELRHLPVEDLLVRAREVAQVIAEKGDIILYRSKKKGETAAAFAKLAEGLACCALVAEGGVRFLGLHFEAKRCYSSPP
jgi:hypothetical protein